jgi:CRISPR/Cas system CMR-associated protein Cmr5 small subunit
MESSEYRRVTEEALEILKWIRQMADAAIKED